MFALAPKFTKGFPVEHAVNKYSWFRNEASTIHGYDRRATSSTFQATGYCFFRKASLRRKTEEVC
jgi:hypothetical protein